MLLRCSLCAGSGLELFAYENENKERFFGDPQLSAGLFEALQLYSKEIGTYIQHIHFSNMILYYQSFGDYSLRIIVDEELNDNDLEEYSNRIMIFATPLLECYKKNNYIDASLKDDFQKNIIKIADSFRKKVPEVTSKISSKIALLGLASAGKSSIKNKFVANWSVNQIENISPSIGLETKSEFSKFLKKNIILMDFAGQKSYRDSYFKEDYIWENITTIIYVIDIQNKGSFVLAKDYLDNISQKIAQINNNRSPKISIFLHKYDPSLREELKENIKVFLEIFANYVQKSYLHLSSIYDQSSNIAFIKSLYLSLPDIVIERIFREGVVDYFKKRILLNYECLKNENYEEMDSELKEKIVKDAFYVGKLFGSKLQQKWLQAIINENNNDVIKKAASKQNKIIHHLTIEGNIMTFTLINWQIKNYSDELIINIWEGVLKGILKTLMIESSPIRIPTVEENALTWKITF